MTALFKRASCVLAVLATDDSLAVVAETVEVATDVDGCGVFLFRNVKPCIDSNGNGVADSELRARRSDCSEPVIARCEVSVSDEDCMASN